MVCFSLPFQSLTLGRVSVDLSTVVARVTPSQIENDGPLFWLKIGVPEKDLVGQPSHNFYSHGGGACLHGVVTDASSFQMWVDAVGLGVGQGVAQGVGHVLAATEAAL